jgi:hypothetical protein
VGAILDRERKNSGLVLMIFSVKQSQNLYIKAIKRREYLKRKSFYAFFIFLLSEKIKNA